LQTPRGPIGIASYTPGDRERKRRGGFSDRTPEEGDKDIAGETKGKAAPKKCAILRNSVKKKRSKSAQV